MIEETESWINRNHGNLEIKKIMAQTMEEEIKVVEGNDNYTLQNTQKA